MAQTITGTAGQDHWRWAALILAAILAAQSIAIYVTGVPVSGSLKFVQKGNVSCPTAECPPAECLSPKSDAGEIFGDIDLTKRTYDDDVSPACPNGCGDSGECSSNRCICKLGFGGPDCSFSLSRVYGELPMYAALKDSPELRPLDLQGWSPEADIYHKYLAAADAVTAIEVGVWKGTSSSHLAHWLKQQNRGVLVSVDTWLGSAEPFYWAEGGVAGNHLQRRFGWPTVFWTFLSNIVRQELEGVVVPLPQPSKPATVVLKNYKVQADFIHVHAGHDYGSCLEDIKLWWPFLRHGGYMMGDDYIPEWPGVVKAADEFAKSCGLELEASGVKWIMRKPSKAFYLANNASLPRYCLEGANEHYDGSQTW